MTTHKRYSDRMAATITEWSTQIGDLQAKARSAGGGQQARIGRQVADLQQQRFEYAQQMRKVRDAGGAVFRDLRQRSERMTAEFRKTYMQTMSRFAS